RGRRADAAIVAVAVVRLRRRDGECCRQTARNDWMPHFIAPDDELWGGDPRKVAPKTLGAFRDSRVTLDVVQKLDSFRRLAGAPGPRRKSLDRQGRAREFPTSAVARARRRARKAPRPGRPGDERIKDRIASREQQQACRASSVRSRSKGSFRSWSGLWPRPQT